MNASALYIVATPIGNLSDITLRAIETLKKVDLIVCEDTRTSKKLLSAYGISTPTMSFYQNINKGKSVKPVNKAGSIVDELLGGKSVAFMTDAGTPGISDPGNQLVDAAVRSGVRVIPVPGASSLTAIASVSGIDMSKFVFLGFPPHKKGRETFFKKALEFSIPAIYYESPHRAMKNLELLQRLSAENFLEKNRKKVIVGREMTKMFEEIVRGDPAGILEHFEQNQEKVKGEFVIIVY